MAAPKRTPGRPRKNLAGEEPPEHLKETIETMTQIPPTNDPDAPEQAERLKISLGATLPVYAQETHGPEVANTVSDAAKKNAPVVVSDVARPLTMTDVSQFLHDVLYGDVIPRFGEDYTLNLAFEYLAWTLGERAEPGIDVAKVYEALDLYRGGQKPVAWQRLLAILEGQIGERILVS